MYREQREQNFGELPYLREFLPSLQITVDKNIEIPILKVRIYTNALFLFCCYGMLLKEKNRWVC